MKLILSWIAFHGITDIFLPMNKYIFFYIFSPISVYVPMNVLNIITVLLSSLHFSYDNIINIKYTLFLLIYLLYYGKEKWCSL